MVHDAVADWSMEPSFGVGQEYNDNFNINPDPLEVWVTNFTGGIRSTLQTEQIRTEIFGEYRGFRYLNERDLDANDGTLKLTSSYVTEYSRLDLTGDVILDHPSSSQIQAGNQVFDRIERLRWSITPTWTWVPNEYSTLQMNYRYNSVSYDDDPNIRTSRSDFFSHSATTSYTYSLEEYTSIFGNLSFVETVNDDLQFKSDQVSLQIGIDHSFSENFNVSLSGGGVLLLSESEIQRLVPNFSTLRFEVVSEKVSSSVSGYIMSVSARKKFAYASLAAQYGRNLAPTINGGQVSQDIVSLSANQQISDHLGINVNLGASKSKSIQSTLSQSDRTQAFADISLSWKFDENWQLGGGYKYRWLGREGTASADRNSIYLNFKYNGSPLFLD